MYEWRRQIQTIVDEIDRSIKNYQDEALTLRALSQRLGYSEYYTARKFKEISGMQFRDYLRRRADHGVSKRSGGQALRLGISAHRMLGGAAPL